MSEIRDRVRKEIQEILLQYMSAIHAELIHSHDDVFLRDKILSIPNLAVVDRKAELPQCPITYEGGQRDNADRIERFGWMQCGKAICKEGWVKEITD